MTSSSVLMIRPAHFSFNTTTAATNQFQHNIKRLNNDDIQKKALQEFDAFAANLSANGIDVVVHYDTPYPHKPDAIFPNNWVTFHTNGDAVIYPIHAAARRLERRHDIIYDLSTKFEINRIIDLSFWEQQNCFLEGTGSMVFDDANKKIYACISPRTSPKLLSYFAAQLGYTPVMFEALGENLIPIYHTNVMLAIGAKLAFLCTDVIKDENQLELITAHLIADDKKIIAISKAQLKKFVCNCLELTNKMGEQILVMSTTAYRALQESQRLEIEEYAKIVHSNISTIETIGGGSARCMLAEIKTPMRQSVN